MAGTEINALTLAVADMDRALDFYVGILDLTVTFGGRGTRFTTLQFGSNWIKLQLGTPPEPGMWGRTVVHVPDPDAVWQGFVDVGWVTETNPADAPWGERYFHVRDPDGHELSFARRLA